MYPSISDLWALAHEVFSAFIGLALPAFPMGWLLLIPMAQLIWLLGDSSFFDRLPLPLAGDTIIFFCSWGPLPCTVSVVKTETLITYLSILSIYLSTRHTIDVQIVAPGGGSEWTHRGCFPNLHSQGEMPSQSFLVREELATIEGNSKHTLHFCTIHKFSVPGFLFFFSLNSLYSFGF